MELSPVAPLQLHVSPLMCMFCSSFLQPARGTLQLLLMVASWAEGGAPGRKMVLGEEKALSAVTAAGLGLRSGPFLGVAFHPQAGMLWTRLAWAEL